MSRLLTLIVALCPLLCFGQANTFPFRAVSMNDFNITSYAKDTSASALVLKEFGEAYIDADNGAFLVYRYHVKIKILKQKGVDLANVTIPLFKRDGKSERLYNGVLASSFNVENGVITETKLNTRQVFTEEYDKNWEAKKFAIPNVKVGSVIEYQYDIQTPFFQHNFKSWSFQSDIPKLESEYWATIPANWRYNISLRGLLPLKKNEADVLKDHFRVAGNKSDCVRYKWSMENVPAFYEEEYMTAKKNFLSAINFELLQIEYFDGSKDKVTKEWRDAEQELRMWEKFGLQLKRGKEVVDEKIAGVLVGEPNELEKAKKIFEFVRHWYQWNEAYGYYSESGIRKAFEARTGNIGDINLSLIAALRYAGINTEPVLLSTRNNGLPTELFPVLSDFNYVVAKVNIQDNSYLLDAYQKFLSFGLLPERCLNGKGRVLGEKESYWYDLKANERAKVVSQVDLTINTDGTMTGNVRSTYLGYRAADKRRHLYSFSSMDHYLQEKQQSAQMELSDHKILNLDDLSKPVVEEYVIKMESPVSENMKSGFLNPFLLERWQSNPFRSQERFYPVDFGTPLEEVTICTINLPTNIAAVDLPGSVALALPNSGGRFFYQIQSTEKKVTINSTMIISKAVYGPEEYASLKEFFNRVVKLHSTDLVFEKR